MDACRPVPGVLALRSNTAMALARMAARNRRRNRRRTVGTGRGNPLRLRWPQHKFSMNLKVRRATADDAQRCGTICYEAFAAIAKDHNFPPDLPSTDVTIGLVSKLIADRRFYGIVAEI